MEAVIIIQYRKLSKARFCVGSFGERGRGAAVKTMQPGIPVEYHVCGNGT